MPHPSCKVADSLLIQAMHDRHHSVTASKSMFCIVLHTGYKSLQVCVINVWDVAGFKETQLPRQGKQSSEGALSLDSSESTEQSIMHVLTLLQSPETTGEAQLQVATAASDVPTLEAASADQPSSSRVALQQSQSVSAQQTDSPIPDRGQQQLGSNALGGTEAAVREGDVQMTNDTTPPVEVAEASGAVATEPAAATLTEGNRAGAAGHMGFDVDMQAMPGTPGFSGLQAGILPKCLQQLGCPVKDPDQQAFFCTM